MAHGNPSGSRDGIAGGTLRPTSPGMEEGGLSRTQYEPELKTMIAGQAEGLPSPLPIGYGGPAYSHSPRR